MDLMLNALSTEMRMTYECYSRYTSDCVFLTNGRFRYSAYTY